MKLVLIAAMDRNRLIGTGSGLPWHLPGDLKRFRARTMGRPMVMGRRTWETIGKPLPGRTSIVVSRSPRPADLPAEVFWVDSRDAALAVARACPRHDDEVAIIGGGEVYALFADIADRLVLTTVEADLTGSVYLPPEVLSRFDRVESQESFPADDRNPHAATVRELVRV